MSNDIPDWVFKPPLSPTETIRHYGSGGPNPSDILSGPRNTYDALAHYERVKALNAASPWLSEDKCHKHMLSVLRSVVAQTRMPSNDFLEGMSNVLTSVLKYEDIYQPSLYEPSGLRNPPSASWLTDFVRPILQRKERFYSTIDERVEAAAKQFTDFFTTVLQHAPEPAYTELAEGEEATAVCFIELAHDPAALVLSVLGIFMNSRLADDNQVFPYSARKLFENYYTVSGYTREELEAAKKPKFMLPADAGLSPIALCDAYLKDTPFLELFMTTLPFVIPQQTRYEHTQVLGSSGSGKTTLVLDQIISDLSAPNPPAIVVIDGKGTLIEQLRRLDVFNPDTGRLKDRMILLDPLDTQSPPAMNIFHPGNTKRFQAYSDSMRRQIENNALSLFQYIFSSIDHKLTAKQAVLYSYALRLMYLIPDATIHKFLQLLNDKSPSLDQSPYKPFIDRLPATPRLFFAEDFYHSDYKETKQQIRNRIMGILQQPELDAMFSSVERRIDMFDALQNRNIVLVNSSKTGLGKEGTQLWGRYMIALTLAGAFERIAIPDRKLWSPAYLIIDEAQEFFDEQKTQELLQQAREFHLGVTSIHQQIEGQLKDSIYATLATNTSIKYVGAPSHEDAVRMARNMNCKPEFLFNQRKTGSVANFACFVRGLTPHPVSLSFELGAIDKQPKMTKSAYDLFIHKNRNRVSAPPEAPKSAPIRNAVVAIADTHHDAGKDPEAAKDW